MTNHSVLPGIRLDRIPVTALSVAPVLVLLGFRPDRWYATLLGLLAVALLTAATWTAHRLRSNVEDELVERRTVAVRLGDPGTRRLYLGLLVAAYLTLGCLAWLQPAAAFALVTAALLGFPGWQVGSGAVSHQLDPVVRDTALVTLYAAALGTFGLLLFHP